MWGYLYGDFGPFTQLAQQFELPDTGVPQS